jgi:hypothetical protein
MHIQVGALAWRHEFGRDVKEPEVITLISEVLFEFLYKGR